MVATIPLLLLAYLTKNNSIKQTKPRTEQSFFPRELLNESRNFYRPDILRGEREGKAKVPSLFVLPKQISLISSTKPFFPVLHVISRDIYSKLHQLSSSFFISNLTISILYRCSDNHFRFSCISLANNLTLLG